MAYHPTDVHVGARLRALRLQRGRTQEDVGRALDVTFQQVQKYETGANRISSSRLYQLATFLDVDVPHFFEGLEPGGVAGNRADDGNKDDVHLLAVQIDEHMTQPSIEHVLALVREINKMRV